MIRSIAVASLCASLALAGGAEEDPRVTEALKHMPTEAEIDELLDEMPDLNRLMNGMIEIAQDEETLATFDRLGNRLKDRFDPEDFKQSGSDLPDLNAMVDSVAGLAADRESMADLLTLAFRMQDVFNEAAERPHEDDIAEPR